MAKIRVYELAKRLGRESKEVLYDLQALGANVRSASSEVAPETAEQLEAFYRHGVPITKAPDQPRLFGENNPLKVPDERARDRVADPRLGLPPRPPRPSHRQASTVPPPKPLTNRIGAAWPGEAP